MGTEIPMQEDMGSVYNDSIKKNLETHLDSLGPEQQEFVAAHLTPEIAQVFGLVLGQEAFDFFNQYTNPDVVLVPMPREALKQGKSEAVADPNVPVQQAPPQQEQQSPQQGLMAQL